MGQVSRNMEASFYLKDMHVVTMQAVMDIFGSIVTFRMQWNNLVPFFGHIEIFVS